MVTDEQRTKIKEYVKILNSISEDLDLAQDFIVDTVIDECLAYCNREDIPQDMERVVARIASNYMNNGLDAQKITSYKELDMSISYSAENNAFNEEMLLQRWRKIRGIETDDNTENFLD